MIEELQAFLVFCEDVRTEAGDKPMLIGVLSPVFELSEPGGGTPDEVNLVTFVHVPYHVKEVALRLELILSDVGKNDGKRLLGTKLTRPADTKRDDPWAAFLPFQIAIDEWRDGSEISARLKANELSATAQLRCRMIKPRTSPRAKGKAKRENRRATA